MAARRGAGPRGLFIRYKPSTDIHQALGLEGSPVVQGATPEASTEAFENYVLETLMSSGLLDKETHSVKSAHGTYIPNIFHHLSNQTYYDLVVCIKDLFPESDRWVEALPGPLGGVFEMHVNTRLGAVEIGPKSISHGPFKQP